MGKSTIGSRAVIAIGTASVAHQIAIKTPMDAVDHAVSPSCSGAPSSNMIVSMDGPSTSPTFWLTDRPSIIALLLNSFSLLFDAAGKATFSLPVRRQFRVIIR
jgi:hypothetical protein